MLKKARLPIVLIAAVCLGTIRTAHAQDRNAQVQKALAASDAWLKLVDAEKYTNSWNQAASFFRDHVTADRWAQMAAAARQPLGALKSRQFKAAQYATHLPGAPAGQYVVIQYDAAYANKPDAVETVTPMLDKDGQWRVSGYYIR